MAEIFVLIGIVLLFIATACVIAYVALACRELVRVCAMLSVQVASLKRMRPLSRKRRGRVEAPAKAVMPVVQVCDAVIRNLAEEINRARALEPGVEHGFALVGRIDGDGEGRRIVVNGLIAAGAKARKSSGHVTFDRDFQQRELEKLQLLDGRASHIGDAHLHPGAMDRCSNGDRETDRKNVLASHTKEMVFCIITAAAEHRWGASTDMSSIYVDGLKLDIFYLGSASNFEYSKVSVQCIAEPMLALPAMLEEMLSRRPEQARLDWLALRSLKDFSLRVLDISEHPRISSPCIELTHQSEPWKLIIMPSELSDSPPVVLVDDGGDVRQLHDDFLAEKWTPHIWLTEIAFTAAEWMASGRRAGAHAPAPSSELALLRR